ncbi:MAG TPA: MFS transporter [Gemmatimonadales bacterium]|nr:MFS transporter [Gemmatimonadales bacterium]
MKRLHYAWTVAAVTFLVLLVAAGIRSTPGVLLVPLEKEFGWSHASISTAVAINLVLYGLIGPFAAAVIDRFGVRRTLSAALVILGVGVGLTTLMREHWQLVLLWGLVVGTGTGFTAMVLGATLVNRWFAARSGTVLGALSASTASGQLVFLPALAALAAGYGWRSAAYLMAGLALLLTPLVAFLIRDFPRDVGLAPYGGSERDAVEVTRTASPVRAALDGLRDGLRSRPFWVLAGTFFICGASTNGLIGTHLIPACADHGIAPVAAAGLLASMGVFDLVGTTASGWLTDRWDSRKLLGWYYGLRGLSLFALPAALSGPEPARWTFAAFYGLDWVATVPPTARLTADVFGKERVGIMFGWIVAAHQLGAATAAWGAGTVRTDVGTYHPAFVAAGALCLVAAAVFLGSGARQPLQSRLAPAAVRAE